MTKELIRSKYKSWRNKEPLCGILGEWSGKKNASATINKLASQPVPIQDILDKIIDASASPEALEFERIKIIWPKIVPEEFKRSVFPYFVKNGILFIKVNDSCSLMEIKMNERRIFASIKKELPNGTVSKIKFLA